MATNVLRLYVDTRAKRLVKSPTSTEDAPAPRLIQGDTVTLEITLLETNIPGGLVAPWTKLSPSGLSAKVGVGVPTAATGGPALGIFQNTFTPDTVNLTLTGTLYINPTTVASILGAATSGAATLEIELSEGGVFVTVLSTPVILTAELIESGTVPPTPVDSYMTTNESTATFVRKIGAAGESITLVSPNGTKQAILYVGDDGILHTDLI